MLVIIVESIKLFISLNIKPNLLMVKNRLYLISIVGLLFYLPISSQTSWVINNPFDQKCFIENKGQFKLAGEHVGENILFGNWVNGINYYLDRKSTRLNSSHIQKSRMPSSA